MCFFLIIKINTENRSMTYRLTLTLAPMNYELDFVLLRAEKQYE